MLGVEEQNSLLAYDLNKDYKPMITEDKKVMEQAYKLGNNLLK